MKGYKVYHYALSKMTVLLEYIDLVQFFTNA